MSGDVKCAECGSPMVLRETSKYQYGDGANRKFYGCSRWPMCNGTHGAHPDGKPLGTPADSYTKRVRRQTHILMDKWADRLGMNKKQRYARLKEAFGCEVHVGELDMVGCMELQEFFEND